MDVIRNINLFRVAPPPPPSSVIRPYLTIQNNARSWFDWLVGRFGRWDGRFGGLVGKFDALVDDLLVWWVVRQVRWDGESFGNFMDRFGWLVGRFVADLTGVVGDVDCRAAD